MKAQEFRELNDDDLQSKLSALRWSIAGMRLKHMKRQLDNPMQLRFARKDVARILTIWREKNGGAMVRPQSQREERGGG